MITIDLNLFVTLSRYLPENSAAFKFEDNKTVQDLISDLNLPDDQVKLIFVNGRKESRQYILKSGDRVGLFPPVGGG